jgi:hypothetical protein
MVIPSILGSRSKAVRDGQGHLFTRHGLV